jgi:type IV pilus assembly protein PilW
VRIGLILRTSLPERDVVSTKALTLFSDLGSTLTYTRTLKTDTEDATRRERHYRYRTVELTIPLRNPLMLP